MELPRNPENQGRARLNVQLIFASFLNGSTTVRATPKRETGVIDTYAIHDVRGFIERLHGVCFREGQLAADVGDDARRNNLAVDDQGGGHVHRGDLFDDELGVHEAQPGTTVLLVHPQPEMARLAHDFLGVLGKFFVLFP